LEADNRCRNLESRAGTREAARFATAKFSISSLEDIFGELIDPISSSATPFCHGEPGAMGLSRISVSYREGARYCRLFASSACPHDTALK
jgi:hypothetical protein